MWNLFMPCFRVLPILFDNPFHDFAIEMIRLYSAVVLQTVMTRYAISIKGQNVFDVHRPTPETSC